MAARTAKSRKAKGRRWQQTVAKDFNEIDPVGRYASTTMGESGTDIRDPNDRLPWNYSELKNHETWPNLQEIAEMMSRKRHGGRWVALYTRNHCKQPLAVMPYGLLLELLAEHIRSLDE